MSTGPQPAVDLDDLDDLADLDDLDDDEDADAEFDEELAARFDWSPVPQRVVGAVLLVAGLLGFTAAFVLAVEKYLVLVNPTFTPTCSVNATVSCSTVMMSPQAALFGFPNPYLGIGGFAVVAASGAMLLSGGRLARWYAAGLQIGSVLGLVFVIWLMTQSLFVIRALCPYCMAAWAATFATVWYVTLHNLTRGYDRLPGPLRAATEVASRNHVLILGAWLVVVAGGVTAVALTF